MQSETPQDRASSKEESQLVTFLLKDEEFGFDIMSVQEIIRLPKMAKVPRTPPYVEGIANLRGVVLPIIDMRTRFGMEKADETDRTRVLVVDIDGVKTGLRVDRVKQVTRVLRNDVDPPPPAIRGTTANYLDGVVKLDNGQRIIMALNAGQVCQIDASHRTKTSTAESANGNTHDRSGAAMAGTEAIAQMVTFRIANEEFAFEMEHVREILRVQPPKQVPDVPDYVLGVLTVRGQILPIVDLRKLLHQPTLADEFAGSCRTIREQYERWIEQAASDTANHMDLSIPERLRTWISSANSSSQVLMETLSRLRGLNEKTIKQAQTLAAADEIRATAAAVIAGLHDFEREVAANIQEDQRIIVVDANGFVLGLVVDHVNEVLNVMRRLLDPPPMVTSAGGLELEAVAKLDDGNRLIMLLDVKNLMRDQKLREIRADTTSAAAEQSNDSAETGVDTSQELSEVQLVTFMLSGEEYGVPISQIQEIDRLSKITKVPKAAQFIEGVTNLRGEVIPVLDTRKRFELEAKASDDRSRIIIVELGGVKTGLIVDSVREVLSLPRKDIAPPPEAIHSGIDQRFISGIGKVDSGKRMVVLLDVEKILSKSEHTALAQLPAE
ncbi:MAG TPA: chemotaxis protein CheW [Bryobacteraceae bacterium]|nr:chemotaxis protein CheW [Bryobacteraceae bacterium]